MSKTNINPIDSERPETPDELSKRTQRALDSATWQGVALTEFPQTGTVRIMPPMAHVTYREGNED